MLKGLFGKRIRLATLKERQSKFGNYDLITPNLNYRAEFQDSLIPQDILKPNYSNVKPVSFTDEIHINSPEEIVEIRKASKLAARCLKLAVEHAKVGTTTNMLDRIVFDEVIKNKAYPSPLGYGFPKYPKSICTSINNVLCHG
jgi:methionyl aminopeptidase